MKRRDPQLRTCPTGENELQIGRRTPNQRLDNARAKCWQRMLKLIQHDNDGLVCLGDGVKQPAHFLLSTAVAEALVGDAIAVRLQTGCSQGVLNVTKQLRRALVFLVQGQPSDESPTLEQLVPP